MKFLHIHDRERLELRTELAADFRALPKHPELRLHTGKVYARLVTLDFRDQQSVVKLVLGYEIDLVLTLAVPPVPKPRPLARFGELLVEVPLQGETAKNQTSPPENETAVSETTASFADSVSFAQDPHQPVKQTCQPQVPINSNQSPVRQKPTASGRFNPAFQVSISRALL